MKEKFKLKFLPLYTGVFLVLTGWFIRLVLSSLILPNFFDKSICDMWDNIGKIISGSSVFFIFGGIIFFALMESKEKSGIKNDESELEKLETEENINKKIEENEFIIKNSMPFTAVYGLMALFVVLLAPGIIIKSSGNIWAIILFILAVLLSLYYIKKIIGQIRRIKMYGKIKKKSGVQIIKELELFKSDRDMFTLRIFDNNTSYILFDIFSFYDEQRYMDIFNIIKKELSEFIGMEVVWEDREVFLIMSSDEKVMKNIILFFEFFLWDNYQGK